MGSLEDLQPRNIVVRMPNWIGDLVMATPILSDLRKAYPHAHITAMSRYPLCDLLREDPEIDELFCFSKGSGFGRRNERRDIVEKLRKGKFDLGILLTHSFSSAWWFWLGGVVNRVGYSCNGRKFFLTKSLPFPSAMQTQHLVITYKMLLQPLGIPLSETAPRIYLTEKEREAARTLLSQYGVPPGCQVVGINPGATYGSAKCWLPERFKEVTERLLAADKDLYIVFFGDTATVSLVKEICEGFSSRVINLAGLTSVRELAALISIVDVLLTNDSGPMHVADAVGTSIIALFGSTSEVVTGPYRGGTVIHKHVDCSPCYQRSCPIDFRCMKRIEADEVFCALMKVLQGKRCKLHIC
jgi:heptosyltransferase-2